MIEIVLKDGTVINFNKSTQISQIPKGQIDYIDINHPQHKTRLCDYPHYFFFKEQVVTPHGRPEALLVVGCFSGTNAVGFKMNSTDIAFMNFNEELTKFNPNVLNLLIK